MRLNKTQRAILAEVEASAQGVVSLEHGVWSRRSFGVRRCNAMTYLMRLGLMVRLEDSVHCSPLYKYGYGQNGVCYVSAWRRTEKTLE